MSDIELEDNIQSIASRARAYRAQGHTTYSSVSLAVGDTDTEVLEDIYETYDLDLTGLIDYIRYNLMEV